MPKMTLRTRMTAIMLAAVIMAGCAAEPSYDDDTYAEVRCPRDYTMRCIKRSAEKERCSCVPRGDVEQMIEVLINSKNY